MIVIGKRNKVCRNVKKVIPGIDTRKNKLAKLHCCGAPTEALGTSHLQQTIFSHHVRISGQLYH